MRFACLQRSGLTCLLALIMQCLNDDEHPKEMMMVSVDAKKDKQGQGWWLHPILLQCGGSKTVRATKLDGNANSSQPNYFGAYVLHQFENTANQTG